MPSDLHAVVHLPAQGARSSVVSALREVGVRVTDAPEGQGTPVVIHEAGAVEVLPEAALAIGVWDRPRAQRGLNPFRAESLRHVIGTSPELANELAATVRHVAQGKPVLIEDLLGANPRVELVRVTSSASRSAVLDGLTAFVSAMGVSARIADRMSTALDELFTNAIYNAPEGADGPMFRATARTECVVSPRRVTVKFGAGERFAAMSVRDEYGTLRVESVLSCLRRCFDYGTDQVEQKNGGAGVGFFMVLQSCTRLVVNVCPGQWTEIVALFDVEQSGRAFANSAPTLNLCVIGAEQVYPSRRASPRFAVLWDGDVHKGDATAPATLLDVSFGGAFMQVDAPEFSLCPGDVVEIHVRLPQRATPILLRARVCRASYSAANQAQGYGLTFTDQAGELDDALRSIY